MPSNNTYRSMIQFPSQKKSDKEKGEEWQKQCIDASEYLCIHNNRQVRQTYNNKKINYNLYNNILDTRDIEKVCNQHELDISSFPAKMQHVGMGSSRIRKLVGDELGRKYEWRVVLSSKDELGISQKEEDIKNSWLQVLSQEIQNTSFDEATMQKRMEKMQKYFNYDYQDIKEITANKLLKYEYIRQDIKNTFNRCFEDLLIAGEEIICIEEVGGEPVVRKVNPLHVYALTSPESVDIEDSDVIIEFSYKTVGQIIDYFYDWLTPQDIKDLEDGVDTNQALSFGGIKPALNREITVEERYGDFADSLFVTSDINHYMLGGAYDSYGNIRLLKVTWKSRRKIGKLTYFDENGIQQEDLVHETYIPNESMGEKVEWIWINEWWEGHKIGSDKYVKIRPIPYQGRSKHNLSISYPPYVGVLANVNSSRVMSLMDIIKPLDYLYDVYNYRTELAVAKYLGPMLAYNLSLIPSGMDMKTWLHYVTTTGLMPLDPTNEILKGPSQGKSAGAFNTVTATNINSDLGNFIQQHLLLMQDIERRIEIISGVSNQSLGQIAPSEKVGNVERVLKGNSQITEKWFTLHDRFKRKVLQRLLDTAKHVYKKNPFRAQYILDDLQNISLQMGDEFFEHDYDIHVSSSTDDTELYYALKQLAHAAMQSGQATFTDVISIYKSESIQATARKLEESSRSLMEQQQAQQAEANRIAEAQIQANAESEAAERELKLYEIDANNATKIQVATISAMKGVEGPSDMDGDGIPDPIEVSKLAMEQQWLSQEMFQKQQELAQKEKEGQRQAALKDKELTMKKEIEDKKIEAIRIQNENQLQLADKKAKLDKELAEKKLAIERIKAKKKPASK